MGDLIALWRSIRRSQFESELSIYRASAMAFGAEAAARQDYITGLNKAIDGLR